MFLLCSHKKLIVKPNTSGKGGWDKMVSPWVGLYFRGMYLAEMLNWYHFDRLSGIYSVLCEVVHRALWRFFMPIGHWVGNFLVAYSCFLFKRLPHVEAFFYCLCVLQLAVCCLLSCGFTSDCSKLVNVLLNRLLVLHVLRLRGLSLHDLP